MQNKEKTKKLFELILNAYPHLKGELNTDPENVDLELIFNEQEGLKFRVSVNLQGDELHLNVGCFWCEWFPLEKVEEEFYKAVDGLLSGNYRIIEYYRGKKAMKAELQRPKNMEWETIAVYKSLHFPFPLKITKKILKNA